MVVSKLTAVITATAAAIAAFLLATQVGVSQPAWGTQKLGGAWIARTIGIPLQWSYVLAPTSSSRRASGHGSLDVGMALHPVPAGDPVSPILPEAVMRGPDVATFNGVW